MNPAPNVASPSQTWCGLRKKALRMLVGGWFIVFSRKVTTNAAKNAKGFYGSDFGFRSSFGLRFSGFGIQPPIDVDND
jgi:hypothetical protein